MTVKDDWVEAALNDDTVVVELLMRLKQSSTSSSQLAHPSPPPKFQLLTLPPDRWGHRQQRTKPAAAPRKESTTTTRFSPTTPLSWSGGAASPSDGGNDESSRLSSDLSSTIRSKGTLTTESISNSNNFKRLRKRKTFAELKEEESLLLKERTHLKKELASLHETLDEQRARSESFKRMKVDINQQTIVPPSNGQDTIFPNQGNLMETSPSNHSTSVLSTHPAQDDHVESQKRCFLLPDLNAPLSEEEVGV